METASTLSADSLPTASPTIPFLPYLGHTFLNISSTYLRAPAPRDVFLAPLRGLAKIDDLLVRKIPNFVIEHGRIGSRIRQAGAALGLAVGPATDLQAGAIAHAATEAAAGQILDQPAATGWKSMLADAFQTSTFKSYFGMLHYLTSRWAFTCFTMALVLNRVQVYASSRQRISLAWEKRLALRIIPIFLLMTQIYSLLQAIRCQSSPEYCLYRHGSMNRYSLLDWAPEGGFLYSLTSTVLSSSDERACAAVGMSRPEPNVRAPFGSFSLLWPTYLRLCVSHLVETIACHLQQTPVMTEVGMSIFEHSLAFAEAETMISHTLGLGSSGKSKASLTSNFTSTGPTIPASGTILAISDATMSLTGSHYLDRVNVPIEVLFVALLSCCNALSSNIVSVFNKQRSLRLINTGFWGMCFIASFIWGFCTTSAMVRLNDQGENEEIRTVSGLLHFPTVAIIGFLPHIMILLGMLVCASIYVVALTLTAFSLSSNPNIPRATGFVDRFRIAHDNLQAAIQVRGIKIKWHEDFYTALLRIGFTALTAASEAVFLNEGRSVEMRQFTWLEEERLDEIETSRSKIGQPESSHFQIAEEYGLPPSSPGASDRGGKWESGYAKERSLEKEKETDRDNSDSIVYPNPSSDGVGALQRTARFYLLCIYIRGIIYLAGGYLAFGLGAVLDRIGITTRPVWLRNLIGRSVKQAQLERNRMAGKAEAEMDGQFWFLTEDGSAATPRSLDTDIESEIRKRLAVEHTGPELEEVLDQKMYEWWSGNGWYGTKDGSGDYEPSHQDDMEDVTSVISMSTNASTTDVVTEYNTPNEREWESESEGRRTPTQRTHTPLGVSFRSSRSQTPASDVNDITLDPENLARLLNPRDRASREEARMLASHLAASTSGNRIMTRSRYRHELETERARVLLAGRRLLGAKRSEPTISLYQQPDPGQRRPLTPEEEVEILESLILSRRGLQNNVSLDQSNPSADDQNTPSLTMPCVVCQAAPRTIIAWPCRCLCVCEDCRVNLALNNFGNCVTCRRSVTGFVRLWTP